MQFAGVIRRHRVAVASTAVVAAAAASLVAYAISASGYTVHHASLNDGGVWVTNDSTGQFGRLNKPIGQLDGAVFTPSAQGQHDIDVLQDGAAVVGVDRGQGQLYPLDVSLLTASKDGVALPADPAVGIGGGVLALLDRAKGTVRAVTFDPDQQLGSIAGLVGGKPLASVGANAALAVGLDGTIYAASASRGLTTIRRAGTGFGAADVRALNVSSANLSVSAVGDAPIVLATQAGSATSTAILPGGATVQLANGGGAVLQQPGPAAAAALVATPHGLLSLSLSGGQPRQLFQGGKGTTPAAPVYLGGCAFAAWPGSLGVFASTCGGGAVKSAVIPQPSSTLTFRVNRQELLLNDGETGNTWNVDTGTPHQVANWAAVKRPTARPNRKTKNNKQNTNQNRPQPPKAVDDNLGARPGRTTSLYVLDNDSDPDGEILAVDSFSASAQVSKWLSIAPDGQTVSIALPAGASGDTTFKYVVRAAKGGTASATVTVHARTPSQFTNPVLRRGAKPRTWTVPEGGTVTIPALSDWRDYTDGDPVVLTGTPSVKAGQVAATPDGMLTYTAPAQPGPETISYTVGTGMGGKGHGTIAIQVEGTDGKAVPAQGEPDYARGEVGKPIAIDPLANDLPGSDPLNPTATMTIAAAVASPPGATVRTDTASGTVTVTASKPGSYLLDYQVAYGAAPLAKGLIRVDVDPASAGKPPVTAPVSAVVHGQEPVTVDVLASAADPAGNLLVVQRATASDSSQLSVAVVDGQFVRVQADTATLSPATQTVQYVITDGVSQPVTGEITVTQLPAASDDTPITITDYARVRSGSSVAIPVLDNDSTPDGDPVSLVPYVSTAPAAGEYTVTPALGHAYVSGRLVRYVAPRVTTTTTVTVDYYAQDQAGDRQQVGHAQVTITPPVSKTNPDQPPAPQEVDARAVAGDTVAIKIPTYGADPDGDPVMVTGIGSAPQLGRVLGFSATSISYQAYPQASNGGTDTFSYVVSDPSGMTAEGTVRVAVVPPGDPQSPVAVDDTVTVAPGSDVRVDVLANDIVAPDDHVTIGNLAALNPQLPKGVRLLSPTGPIEVPSSGTPKHPVVFRYQISDGLANDRATVTVHSQNGVDLPPVAFDQYARVLPGATSVVVDLLHGDYDPDGTAPLTVVSPAPTVGGRYTIPLTGRPQVIPYVVRDSGGAQASAVVYVPGEGAGAPYAKPGAQITVPYNGSATIAIGTYVIDPAHKPVRTTTSDTISASPAGGLTATAGADATHLVLRAGKNYDGPAAVTFQVTDGATLTAKDAAQAYVTVPVQVGAATPQLRCPSSPTTVMEGGPAVSLPIATLCHVWTPNPADAARLTFTGRWGRHPAGVNVSGSGTAVLSVRAGGSATPGAAGTLLVSVAGSKAVAQPLAIQVIKAPKLTVAPIVLTGIQAGHSATVDIAPFVDSRLADAQISIVGRPRRIAGMAASISASGSRVTIRPGGDSHGTITFALVVTDVSDRSRTDRQVPAQITLQVLGHPGRPTGLAWNGNVESDAVVLSWLAPPDNGAPIVRYIGTYNGGQRFTCGAAPKCTVTGLQNGVKYTFTVTAYNAVGPGPASAPTSATPNAAPGPVQDFVGSNPQDRTLTLSWKADTGDWSPVTSYTISWTGGSQQATGSQTSVVVHLASNDAPYSFTIFAINSRGRSQPSTASGILQSAGKPATPGAPSVTVADDTATNSRVANLSWNAVDPQGPTPVAYTVIRTGGGAATDLCPGTTQTTCRDTGIKLDGTVYTYAVQAHNAAGADPAHTSAVGPGTTMEAAATPDPITNIQTHVVSATPDGQAPVTFTVGASHGKTSTVTCSYSGGSCASPTTYAVSGQDASQILNFPSGYSGSFTLTDCNGSSGNASQYSGASCTTSSAVAVSVNAPPSQPGGGSCGLSGTTVIFNWSASRTYGARTLDHYALSNAINTNTTATSASVNEPADGGSSTLTVVAVDSNGEQSSANSYSCPHAQPPPPPPPTSWTVKTTTTTCPDKLPSGANWNNGSCDGQGRGWIRSGTTLTVYCYYTEPAKDWNGYGLWFAYDNPNDGWSVAAGTTTMTSAPSGMPAC